jgi:transcriptional regulator with XRE-family HTH domain
VGVDAGEIGRRIKRTRNELNLTLKALESGSRVSATHISEIERGATVPTIGALERIARALGRSVAYFLEESELGEVSLVTAESRVRETVPGGAASIERLTASIAGGRLQAGRIVLAPGRSHRAEHHRHDGAEAIVVLRGSLVLEAAGQRVELAEGDTAHFDAREPHAYTNASRSGETVLIWVASRRDVD